MFAGSTPDGAQAGMDALSLQGGVRGAADPTGSASAPAAGQLPGQLHLWHLVAAAERAAQTAHQLQQQQQQHSVMQGLQAGAAQQRQEPALSPVTELESGGLLLKSLWQTCSNANMQMGSGCPCW